MYKPSSCCILYYNYLNNSHLSVVLHVLGSCKTFIGDR